MQVLYLSRIFLLKYTPHSEKPTYRVLATRHTLRGSDHFLTMHAVSMIVSRGRVGFPLNHP